MPLNLPSIVYLSLSGITSNPVNGYMDLELFIERITKVNHNTVIRWVKQAGNRLPDNSSDGGIAQVAQLNPVHIETWSSEFFLCVIAT